MKIAVFSKKRQSQDGRSFYNYIGRLKKKDGTELSCGIRFRDPCVGPKPDACPCYISIEKKNANMSMRQYLDEKTGEMRFAYTLWVTEYTLLPEKWEDHSLDDFDD